MDKETKKVFDAVEAIGAAASVYAQILEKVERVSQAERVSVSIGLPYEFLISVAKFGGEFEALTSVYSLHKLTPAECINGMFAGDKQHVIHAYKVKIDTYYRNKYESNRLLIVSEIKEDSKYEL
jgi:hypothetical protein